MRIGAPLPELVDLATKDPAARALLIAQGAALPDDKAELVLEVVDASAYGKNQKIMRYGIGAAAGLAVGAGLVLLLKR